MIYSKEMPSLQRRYKKYTNEEKLAYARAKNERYIKPKEKPKNLICVEVGNRILSLRQDAGLTQVKLGALAGTRQSTIARIESGKHNLSIKKMEKLSKILGKTLKISIN